MSTHGRSGDRYQHLIDSRIRRWMNPREYSAQGVTGLIGVTLGWFADRPAVILTDLPDNCGPSVTSSCEFYAAAAWNEFRTQLGVDHPAEVAWFEHYPGSAEPDIEYGREYVDEIDFGFGDVPFKNRGWQRSSLHAIGIGEPSLVAGLVHVATQGPREPS